MSDTTSVSGATPSTPPRQSRFSRNVRIAYSEGRIDCAIETHFQVRAWIDPTTQRRFTDVERKPLALLYDMMMPGQSAKCQCLKLACELQWRRNFHGAYTTTAIAPGSYTKGIGAIDAQPKKVYSLRYSLKPDDFKYLIGRFPEWHFVTVQPGTHDHPIAHTSTRIAAERLMDKLRRGTVQDPLVYVDLNGNPGANEQYMRRNPGIRIITVVEAVTPKDFVRMIVKWGDAVTADGTVRWVQMSLRDVGLGFCDLLEGLKISGFISIHTLYYYDHAEVVRVLNRFKCPMYAAQHRFKDDHGSLNNGEQVYVKRLTSSQTIVYQTTVATNAMYDHPDNSVWFDHDSLTYGDEGIGWDHNLLSDDTFYTFIVPVPRVQCEMSASCLTHANTLARNKLPVDASMTAQSQQSIATTNTMTLCIGNVVHTAPIASSHVEFLGEMRKHALGKARTAAQYRDHVSRCKIALASLTKNGAIKMDAQQLDQICRFSFFMDLPDQSQLDRLAFDHNYATIVATNALYRDGTIVHIAARGAKLICDMLLSAAECSTPLKAGIKVGRMAVAQFSS